MHQHRIGEEPRGQKWTPNRIANLPGDLPGTIGDEASQLGVMPEVVAGPRPADGGGDLPGHPPPGGGSRQVLPGGACLQDRLPH